MVLASEVEETSYHIIVGAEEISEEDGVAACLR